jgi:hypothetical protein
MTMLVLLATPDHAGPASYKPLNMLVLLATLDHIVLLDTLYHVGPANYPLNMLVLLATPDHNGLAIYP